MENMFRDAASFKQKLRGVAWVRSPVSKEAMFTGSFGSIPTTRQQASRRPAQRYMSRGSTRPTRKVVSRRPIPGRELIVRVAITTPVSTRTLAIFSNDMTCPKCGMFKKSGRVSCCAPGGAWYKNCGGAGNRNAQHTWFEGTEACKRKSTHVDRFSRRPSCDCVRVFIFMF